MTNPLSDYQNEKLIEWGLKQVMYGKCKYLRPDFLSRILQVYHDFGADMKFSDIERETLEHRIKHENFESYLGADFKKPNPAAIPATHQAPKYQHSNHQSAKSTPAAKPAPWE